MGHHGGNLKSRQNRKTSKTTIIATLKLGTTKMRNSKNRKAAQILHIELYLEAIQVELILSSNHLYQLNDIFIFVLISFKVLFKVIS